MKNLCFAAAFAACALVPSAASAGDTHFRWGVGGGTGYFAPAGLVDFNVGLRLGAQFNEKMGVYGELGSVFGFGFGGSVSENGASLRAKAVGLYGLTPVFEYSFGGGFIGGGPVLARGSWVAVKQSADDQGNVSQSAYVAGGSFVPGLDFRDGRLAVSGWTESSDLDLPRLGSLLTGFPCPGVKRARRARSGVTRTGRRWLHR